MTVSTQTGGRYALIVAVSDYRDAKLRRLRAPAADAERLGAVLHDPEIGAFDVEMALDEDEAQLRRRIARFFSARRPDDLLLVHFSCHGVKDQAGELYLAAADTELGDLLGATGISATWLSEQIGRSRSRRVVVLLDCCFSGSFPFGMRSRAGQEVNVREHLEGRGRAVITASSAMEYSYEGDELSGEGEPSIFTDAVVDGLQSGRADRDGDHWVSVDDLYDYVYDRVKETTPHQTPNKLSTLEGPLYIARSRYERPVEPVALPRELADLVGHPYAGARLGAVDELVKLLSSQNPGIRMSARLALEQLVDDDSRSVAERARAALARGEETSVARPEPPTPRREPPTPRIQIPVSRAETTAPHAAAIASIAGAVLVIVSILFHDPLPYGRANVAYRLVLTAVSIGVITTDIRGLRARRGAPFLVAAGLALVLVGLTFPMSWGHEPLPRTFGFWLAACGAAVSAAGVGYAAWITGGELAASDDRMTGGRYSKAGRALLAVSGPALVVASLFVLPEWSYLPRLTTWQNWQDYSFPRYPATMMVLCAIAAGLAVSGIWRERRRLVVLSAGTCCLILGEAVPLIYLIYPHWGSGRWLRIAAAVVAVAGTALAAAWTPVAASRRL